MRKRRINWRWAVMVLGFFLLFEVFFGVMAYSSSTWNFSHTEVLYRWDAVREVCLVFLPLTAAGAALLATLAMAATDWAMKGDRE